MREAKPERDADSRAGIPWALHLQAVALDAPDRLLRTLTDAIVSCGGWVLSRGANDAGTVTVLFEFERLACVDMYGGLIGAGLELSRNGHLRFTELCQCTKSGRQERGTEIASIDLEIQTYSLERTTQAHASPVG